MPTQWKSITVFLDDTVQGEHIGAHAARVATAHRSHLAAVYGLVHAVHASMSFARGSDAIKDTILRLEAHDAQALLGASDHLRRIADGHDVVAEFRVLWKDWTSDEALFHALHTDLVILSAGSTALPPQWSPERIVLDAGVPVLLVSPAWTGSIGRRVLLAWNGSRESRRAIVDALPFLAAADNVTVLTVDADERPAAHGEEPGADIARYLLRHGIAVDVHQAASRGVGIADVITQTALDRDCDLVVIGAYSHSRRAELLFGGVTRTLLGQAGLPVFVSR